MGRREDRDKLQKTWVVYQPLKGKQPLKREQMQRLKEAPVGSSIDKDGLLRIGTDENQGS